MTGPWAPGRMLCKHQLPPSPAAAAARPPLLASCPGPRKQGTLVAVGVGARRVLLVRGDCRLATVEAPANITTAAFCSSSSASASCRLLLGCASGALYQLPLGPLLAQQQQQSDRHGVLIRLEEQVHRFVGRATLGGGAIQRLLPLSSHKGARLLAVVGEGAAAKAVWLLDTAASPVASRNGGGGQDVVAVPLTGLVSSGDEQIAALACLDAAAAPAVCKDCVTAGPIVVLATASSSSSSSSAVRWHRCSTSSPTKAAGGQLPPTQGRVVALLPSSSKGLLLVEETGRVVRLMDGAWQEAARPLQLGPGADGRVAEAILLLLPPPKEGSGEAEAVAYRTAQGAVWVAELAALFASTPGAVAGMRVDLAPDAVAITGHATSALFVLTRRGRLVCMDVRGAAPSLKHHGGHETPSRRRVRPPPSCYGVGGHGNGGGSCSSSSSTNLAEEEALVRQIEAASRATTAERARLAGAEAALERLRSAWAVVAGRGLLEASLDLEHESAGPPRLWARLQNPPDGEPLPLRGWSLLLRLEPATEPPAPSFLLRRGRQGAAGAMSGGSWPLDDLDPGDRFQASLPLVPDVVGSPLPVTARLALCYPFAAAAEAEEGDGGGEGGGLWPAGICLELGSRPLDMLDLARAPRRVPSTPSDLRLMEAQAEALATTEHDKTLAALLLKRQGSGRQEDGAGLEEDDDELEAVSFSPFAAAAATAPRPVFSDTLKLLWPVEVGADGRPTALPGLSDLLGACDGARMGGDDGRSLAIEAPGGRVLVARLLLGAEDGSDDGGGGGATPSAPTLVVEEGAVPAVAMQLTLSATDRGLLGLLRAACLQRLGPGAAVRTRRLALTQARMRALERAHKETTALAQELGAHEEEGMDGPSLKTWVVQAARAVEVAMALGREMDEACLLDLRPPQEPLAQEGMEVV